MAPLFHPAIKRLHFFFGYAIIEEETLVGNGIFASDSNVVPIRKRAKLLVRKSIFAAYLNERFAVPS